MGLRYADDKRYADGKPDHKVSNANLVDHLEGVIRKRVADKEKLLATQEQIIAKSS